MLIKKLDTVHRSFRDSGIYTYTLRGLQISKNRLRMMATVLKGLFQPTQSRLQNVSATFVRWGSAWRDATSYREVWPNYKFHRSHKKHYVLPHTIGKQMVNIALSKFLQEIFHIG